MRPAVPGVLVLEQHLVEVEARRIIDDERAVAVPVVEAIGRDLVAVAPVLAVAREDQPDGVAWIGRLEGRPAVVVDHVVRWRRDGTDVRGRALRSERVADPAEGKELGHGAVRFRDEGRPLVQIVAYRSRATAERSNERRETETWNRPPTTHSRKGVACSPTRARTPPSWPSSGHATSSPTRARFARPWAGRTSGPGSSRRRGPSSRGRWRSTLSTTTPCSPSGCPCCASATEAAPAVRSSSRSRCAPRWTITETRCPPPSDV